jgi:putative polyhydroxyalkanoate system protein
MANIHVRQQHNKSEQEVRQIADQLARKLDSKYQLSSKWNGNTLEFKRSGLHGSLIIGASEVSISLKLGMMMSAFAGKIKNELAKSLKDTLA